jgi:hypothetical protein
MDFVFILTGETSKDNDIVMEVRCFYEWYEYVICALDFAKFKAFQC